MSLKNEKLDFIKQFAFEQFKKYGYSRITMDEIAKETGTGKGTLYRYFPSKEALLMAAIHKNTTEIEKKLQLELTEDKNALEKLNCYIAIISQRLRNIDSNKLTDIRRNVPQAYQLIQESRERLIIKTLTSILEEGKESGIFRNNLDTMLVTRVLLGGAEHFSCMEEGDLQEHSNLTRYIQAMFETILLGCYSEKGRKISGNL